MSARVACWLCYILEKLSVTHNQTVTNDFPVILLPIGQGLYGCLNISK